MRDVHVTQTWETSGNDWLQVRAMLTSGWINSSPLMNAHQHRSTLESNKHQKTSMINVH